jgi:hypothetical protein
MKTKRTKVVAGFVGGPIGLLLMAAVALYVWAWGPGRRSSDPGWW